jgi:hypothetical protein
MEFLESGENRRIQWNQQAVLGSEGMYALCRAMESARVDAIEWRKNQFFPTHVGRF